MGCVNSKGQDGRISGPRNPVNLSAHTAFSINDVEALTVLFKKMCNSIETDGKISKEELKLALFNNSQQENLFADRIFNLFDVKQKGKIYFADFIKVFHVFHPDTAIEAKIDFSFKLFDLNGDGVIDRQEVREMVAAILSELEHEPTDELLEIILERTFSDADVNGDGNLGIDEWRAYVNRNPGAIEIMTIPYLKEVTTIFPDFVFLTTVKDEGLIRYMKPGSCSTSTAQSVASTSTARPASQPGASTSTAPSAAQPGASTSTVPPAAQPECSTSTAPPAAQPECSTSMTQPAAQSECSTSTVQPECSTSTAQPGGSTSVAHPESLPECSTSTAHHDAQPGCSTSAAQPDVQPGSSTSTTQPGGSTSVTPHEST